MDAGGIEGDTLCLTKLVYLLARASYPNQHAFWSGKVPLREDS